MRYAFRLLAWTSGHPSGIRELADVGNRVVHSFEGESTRVDLAPESKSTGVLVTLASQLCEMGAGGSLVNLLACRIEKAQHPGPGRVQRASGGGELPWVVIESDCILNFGFQNGSRLRGHIDGFVERMPV